MNSLSRREGCFDNERLETLLRNSEHVLCPRGAVGNIILLLLYHARNHASKGIVLTCGCAHYCRASNTQHTNIVVVLQLAFK